MRFRYWLFRLLCWLALDLRIYYVWSRIYRWLREGPFLSVPVKLYENEERLRQAMDVWQWKRQPLWRFNFHLSTPSFVEYLSTAVRPVGDCDFGVYAAAALQLIAEKNGTIGGKVISDISILTVPWLDNEGKIGGLNACVFRWMDSAGKWSWAWVSSWYDCKIQWEHPASTSFETAAQVAAHLCIMAETTNIRWARVRPDLKKVLETGTALC